jgi:hypothetical protein
VWGAFDYRHTNYFGSTSAQKKGSTMAKNVKNKTSKAPALKKSGMKAPIKTSKVEATKLGSTLPGGGWRLAGNHNENLLIR